MRRLVRWLGISDGPLTLAALGLVGIGCLAMASAASTVNEALFIRHLVWIALGLAASIAIARTAAHRVLDASWVLYGLSLAALAIVLIAGAVRLGASRWLSVLGLSLQPSELAKVSTVWVLARYLAGQPSPLPPRVVFTSLVIAGLPAALVFVQPDLGSATIFAAIWCGMIWMAGASRRTMIGCGLVALAVLPIGWHALKGYQRDRLLAFVNPSADPLGAGYTIIQSMIAIGAGQLMGRGWFAGTQNQLSFLPERHSDFIFSVIGEEWGFFGCLTVILLIGAMLLRIARLGQRAPDPYARLLAAGTWAWFAYQATVNLGMVMGMLPVVGIPLPFISYGGSSMLSLWMALGMLQGVARASE